jgi:hypothetical protein
MAKSSRRRDGVPSTLGSTVVPLKTERKLQQAKSSHSEVKARTKITQANQASPHVRGARDLAWQFRIFLLSSSLPSL